MRLYIDLLKWLFIILKWLIKEINWFMNSFYDEIQDELDRLLSKEKRLQSK